MVKIDMVFYEIGKMAGTEWFYIENGPTSTEMVKDTFDQLYLNCVSHIIEQDGKYWVFVDMGRSCSLLAKECIIPGWKIYRNTPWQQ